MASLNAQAVAHKVLETVRKGNKVNLRKIIKAQGYSESVSTTAEKVTKTKSYMAVIKPILPQLEKERQRIIKAMGEKDLSQEKYMTLLAGLDILTKNTQLLGGKATENIGLSINISEAIAKKNTLLADDKDTK